MPTSHLDGSDCQLKFLLPDDSGLRQVDKKLAIPLIMFPYVQSHRRGGYRVDL